VLTALQRKLLAMVVAVPADDVETQTDLLLQFQATLSITPG
jgi:hypothetical protein